MPVYSFSQSRSYYVIVNGDYKQVRYDRRKGQWGYDEGIIFVKWVAVTPKKSADDKTPDAVQFYGTSKMDALKAAARSFIDETEKNNASISDPAKRHHISLVKFADDSYKNGNQDSVGNNFIYGSGYNYTQIVSNFTDNVDALKANVNELRPAGATAADYGMNLANRVLDATRGHGARKDAQKVVILFTDGEPNHESGFSKTVANKAIENAKTLKDNGALVYSLCIFEQANPDDLSQNFNRYMHAVSSNYPQAQSLADMGARAENSNYYKAAVDADDLNKIFQEISDEIGSGTGFPTATEEGAAGTSGFITFSDKLGEYMQVDSFGKLIFGEKVFRPTSNPTIEQGTTTVTYEGTVENPLYPTGNLNQIKITIERSADLATGDVVTVKVPAGLIPLRKFDIDVKQGASTMNVVETYPLHVFYNVSLKPEVKDAIVGGLGDSPADAKLKTYIENHLDSKGQALFYSNFYNKAKLDGAALGDTTATYAPAKGNSFYYFTEDTPIFREEACQNHVVGTPNPADTYYYQKPYYAKNPNGSVVEKQEVIRFKGSSFASLKEGKDWGYDADGNIVLKAGAARLTRVDDKVITKKDNTTQTASHATDPRWKNPNGPQDVVAYLGNNGRVALEMPSSLSITKDATVAPDKGLDEQAIVAGKKFTFVVNMPTMKGKTVKAEVLNFNGLPTGEMFDFTFNADGTREQQVQDGETLVLHGLSAGTHYTVTEKDQPAGFALTAVDGKAADKAEGNIQQNKAQEHTFVNTYDVKAVDLAAADFVKYQKTFDRWDIAREFELKLTGLDGAPMPEGTKASASSKTVKVSDGNTTGNFGKITFDKAGTFTYTVTEVRPQDLVAGVTYSAASYTVTVRVEDKNADGALDAPVVTVTKTVGDDGHELAKPETVADRTAAFTNSFNAESTKAAPQARKHYTDNSGKKPLADNMFEFSIKPTGDNAQQAPFPKTGLEADGSLHVRNAGESVSFPQVEFDAQHLGTFTYELKEVVPAGAVDNHDGTHALDGMTYDGTVYTVAFKVESVDAGHDNAAKVRVTKTYKKNGAVVPEQDVVFNNVYSVTAAELPAQGDGAITVQKTLNGRDAKADEKFTFVMSAKLGDEATQQALKNNDIVLGDNDRLDTLEVQLGELKNGQVASAGMGKVRFTKPGVYHFVIREKAPSKDVEGMKYDRHVCEVTVTVTDNKGTLSAKIAYNNGKGASTANAAFVNTYASHADLSAAGAPLTVVKQLTGRDLKTEEFTFTMAGVDSDTVKAAEADKLLADTDREFKNNQSVADGKYAAVADRLNALTFTQADAGKTFSFSLKEVVPAEGKLAGVTYDRSEFRIDIKPVDNADGSMHFEETVWQVKDNKGAALDKPVEVVSVDTSKADAQKIVYAVFRNAYHADAVDVNTGDPAKTQFKFEKVLNGRAWQEGDSFRFTIEPDALTPNAPMPLDAAGNEVHEATVSASAGTPAGEHVPFTFGNKITFTEAGTYKYVVREDATSPIAGIEYADTPAVATVVVSDPGNGKLNVDSITLEYETFANTYKAQGSLADGGVSLDISKTLSGRDMQDGEFSFAIDGKDEASKAKLPNGVSNINMGAAADGTAATVNNVLDGMKFTEADAGKTFTFKIAEQVPQDTPLANVTYDKTYYELEVTVADNGDGTLKETGKLVKFADGAGKGETVDTFDTSVVGPKALTAAFKNTYTPDPIVIDPSNPGEGVTGSAEFTKVLEGRKWLDSDEFTFTLTPVDGAPMPQGKDGTAAAELTAAVKAPQDKAQATVNFAFNGSFSFKREGTYKYNVVEKHAGETIKGLSYDADRTAPARMIVEVTKSGDGKLHAAVRVENGAFKNIYKAGGTDRVDISKATEGGARLVKVLKGRDWNAGDGFEFSIEATGDNKADAPMPAPATVRVSSEDAASGTEVPFAFDKVSFDKAGTYTYEVRETKGSIGGVTYDGHTATITVKVTDDGLGKLKAAVSIDKPDFVNKYTAVAPTPEAGQSNVTFTKKLVGRDWHNGETFSFTMTGEDGAPMPEGSSNGTKTVKAEKPSNGNTAKFGFGPITYTFADVENAPQHTKRFVYTIREDIPAEGDRAPHLTYDSREVKLYVTVKDYGDGLLGVSSDVENGAVDATFVNTYKAELDFTKVANGAGLTAHKVLSGRDMTAGQFGISVAATGDNAVEAADKLGIAEGDKGTQFAVPAGANGQDVAVDLLANAKAKGGMKFTQDDLNKTFTYRIWESQGGGGGYVNDAGSYTVTFTPELSGKDELQVKVTRTATDGAHAQGPNEITVSSQGAAEGIRADFLNAYKAEGNAQNGNGSIALTAAKKLSGRPLQAGEFSFKRALVNAKTGQVEDVFAREAKNDAAGKIDFGMITFNSDELNKLAAEGKIGRTVDAANGNATWTIKMRAWELTDGLPAGVSAVDDHVDFTIAVTDNGDGTLSKPQIGPKDVKLEFINNYTAGGVDPDGKPTDGKTSLALKGSKTLKTTDGGLQQSEIAGKFSFTLAPETEGAPMPAKATVTNDAAGNVDFGVIEFTLDNLNAHLVEPAARSGQSRSFDYVYKVTESGSLPGVTNDTAATKTVTIAVTDDGKGVLSAAVKDVAAGQPAFGFVNTYAISEGGKPSVSPTDNGEGRFSVTKHLEGRELQAGEFSFELVENATGKVVAEGVNDAEGNVELGKIKFTEPGTRTFTLRERKGDKGGVTYSTVEYAVTAQAVDNHMGALEVTFTVHDAAGKEVKDLIFTNTYKADPTSLQINAVKVLTGEGAKLGSGQFEFVIENADSKRTEIAKAHNGEAVNNAAPVEFQSIPLDKAGDYHLAMREVKGKDAQIVYDDSVIDITFTVVDDQNGKLVVKDNAVKYAVDGKPVEQPVFRNEFHAIVDGLPLGPGHIDAMDLKPAQKHEPAKKPADKNKLVQTGDNAGIGIALVAAAGVAVLGGGLLIKRRSNR